MKPLAVKTLTCIGVTIAVCGLALAIIGLLRGEPDLQYGAIVFAGLFVVYAARNVELEQKIKELEKRLAEKR